MNTNLLKIALFVCFTLLEVGHIFSQTIQLGSGTATNGTYTSSPVNIWYRRTVAQFVYTAAELNAAGISGPCDLQDLGWFVTQSPIYNLPGYTVKVKHVTANNVSAALGTTGWTTIKGPFTYNPTAGGWDMLSLDNTFSWNGTDNIGVEVCWSQVSPSYSSSGQCRIYSTSSGYRYSWTDASGSSCGSTPYSTTSNKPQVQMVWSCGPPCTTPAPPSASGATVNCGDPATLTASGAPGNGDYIWYSDANGSNQVGTGSSFTTPSLNGNTTYYVSTFVPANCESSLTPVTVNVNGPNPPTANGVTINCGDPATLTASGSTGNYEWYSDANGNNSIGTGNSISLGNLFADSTVYVASTSGSSSPGSATFTYTGAVQNWTVPAGVTQIDIAVWGAEGGGSALSGNGSSGQGGKGGYSSGTLNVTPGEVLSIYVGGHGASSTSGVAAGGFNGGGSGYASSSWEPGNGGGGASDVRQGGNALPNRVIVAGGGGGGGEDSGDSFGHGGGLNGVGYSATYDASQTGAGLNGALGQGATTISGDGGGGGGGYYGGGTNQSTYIGGDTQGGGGGSGYIGGVSNGQTIAGNASMPNPAGGTMIGRSGHGLVQINYSASGCVSSLVPVTAIVNPTPGPTVSGNTSICGSGSTTLTATGSGNPIEWYSDPGGTNLIATGSTFTTPNLNVNTTYYVASSTGSGSVSQSVGFNDCYAPSNWSVVQLNGGNGSVNSGGAPNSIQLTGPNNTGGNSYTIYEITVPVSGTISWSWNVAHNDCGYDTYGYQVNGVDFPLATCSASGTTTISVSAGSTFAFYGRSLDGCCGTFTATITNFNKPCASPPSCLSQLVPVTVTIDQPSVVATGVSGTGSTCLGSTSTLTVQGGTLNGTSNWQWFSGSCNGTPVGTGTSITVTPTTTTTYYVSASANGACPATTCTSGTVTLPTQTNQLSINNSTSTCIVNDNNFVHFLDANGRLIASINSQGQNLGNVTATSFVENTPLLVQDCAGTISTSVLDRHWLIQPAVTNPGAPVIVRLPVNNTELNSLITESNNNTNSIDDVNGLTDIYLSKYSGPSNLDNDFVNNCPGNGGNGNTQIYPQVTNGILNNIGLFANYPASDFYIEFVIPNFSEFWLHGSNIASPLPVTFTDFSAECGDKFTTVKWSTASEQNSSHFTLERSSDGNNWQKIATIEAQGNSSNEVTYEFNDSEVMGLVYYRLKQYDNDGVYSQLSPISADCNTQNFDAILYPNPTQKLLNIELANAEFGDDIHSIIIHDMQGRMVDVEIIKHSNSKKVLDVNKLKEGVYNIQINTNKGRESINKRFTVIK